jgi:glycosyltransferase involved in cell wall biosynthesis
MLSIIIPTLNEEKYLPLLLASIAEQTYRDFEVIVADAGSRDNTAGIAQASGCKVVKGGMPGVGRNNGARVANGDWLLFLDADVILPPAFLQAVMENISRRRLDVATCAPKPLSGRKTDRVLHSMINFYFKATQAFWPHAPGFCIFAKKPIHDAINGFDERIQFAEDQDYVLRASKIARFRYIKKVRIPVSVRRLEKDGRFVTSLKYLIAEIHLIFVGPIRSDIFKYKFGHF